MSKTVLEKANGFLGVPLMQYGVSILKIISLVVLSRSLSADGYGDFSYLTTVVTMLLTLTYAGGQTITLRLFSNSNYNHDQVYTYSVRAGLYASIVAILVFPIFIYFSNTGLPNLNIWILLVSALLLAPTKIISLVHNAFNKQRGNFVKVKFSEFASTLVFIVLVIIFRLFNILTIESTILLFIIQSITLLLLVMNKYKKDEVSKDLRTKFRKDFAKLYPSGLFAYVVSSSDIIMLGLLSTNVNVGYYAVAVRIYSMMTMFPASINMFFSSRIGNNEFFENGEFAKYSRITMSFCVLSAVMVFFISEYIIILLSGVEFFKSVLILKILAGAFIFRSASYIFAAKWIHLEKYSFLSTVSSINGISNIILNLIFIPKFGAVAAAWTSLFSYSIGFTINIYLLIKLKPNSAHITDYFLIKNSDIVLLYNKYVKPRL
ncbi:MAG: oligosaccharide flippase family protein [Balneolaceae bacterium]|nr:oligosaccharide flippase family protein [Balneolaceae bacterium]